MTKKSRYIRIAVFAILAVALICFIFSHSAKPATESAEDSIGFVDSFGGFGLDIDIITLTNVVRKLAHFAEYFALGAVGAGLLDCFNRKLIYASPIFALIVALIDEFAIQAATPGRSPEWRDIGIDLAGALCAMIAADLILRLLRRKKEKKK